MILFFERVDYYLHKITLKKRKIVHKSPKWLENKKATINPQNNDDKYSRYAITVTLNHQNFEKNSERISNIRPFIN